MTQQAFEVETSGCERDEQPSLSGETRRHLGTKLRLVYEQTLDTQPIPDTQVDLLLQLRHKERDLRRAG